MGWLAMISGWPVRLIDVEFDSQRERLTLRTPRLDHELAEHLLSNVRPTEMRIYEGASMRSFSGTNTQIDSGRTTVLGFRITDGTAAAVALTCSGCDARLEHVASDWVLVCNQCGAMFDETSLV